MFASSGHQRHVVCGQLQRGVVERQERRLGAIEALSSCVQAETRPARPRPRRLEEEEDASRDGAPVKAEAGQRGEERVCKRRDQVPLCREGGRSAVLAVLAPTLPPPGVPAAEEEEGVPERQPRERAQTSGRECAS